MRPAQVRPPSRAGRKPFQPAIGRDFDVESVPTVEAGTRGMLARGITHFAGFVVVMTGGYGAVSGDFQPLMASWAVIGPIIGAIVAYYFGPRRTDTS